MAIDPSHPEAFCEECGRANINWSIDSDRWNLATAHRGQILCPVCFVQRHEAATGLTCAWTLRPITPFRPASPSAGEVGIAKGDNDGR